MPIRRSKYPRWWEKVSRPVAGQPVKKKRKFLNPLKEFGDTFYMVDGNLVTKEIYEKTSNS